MRKTDKYANLEERINGYFSSCDLANEGQKEIKRPYTMSGLLCHIGISRQEYEKLSEIKRHKELFSKAASRIEAFIEENMLAGTLSCNASLNSLKYNFGWGEKTEKEEISSPKQITVTLSPETAELAK